jgi:hypothetical protein
VRNVVAWQTESLFDWTRASAEDLYVTLYEVGEHIAAGAPISPPAAEEVDTATRTAITCVDVGAPYRR